METGIRFTPEQIRELTDAAVANLKPQIGQLAIDSVKSQVVSQVQYLVAEEIKTVLNEEFRASLAASLAEMKPQIAEQAGIAAVELAKALVVGLVTSATKTLADDYKRRSVLQELIGKY